MTSESRVGINRLLQQGYDPESWDTNYIMDYLLEEAPSNELRQALSETLYKTKDALENRDMETQRLVMNDNMYEDNDEYFLEDDEEDIEDEEYLEGDEYLEEEAEYGTDINEAYTLVW